MTIAKSKALWPAILLAALLAMLVFTVAPAAAAAPPVVGDDGGAFLCVDAGLGVLNNHGGNVLPSGGVTFLPGHNQAGAHADSNSYNADSAADSPGPGNGNTDWSPIWPPSSS